MGHGRAGEFGELSEWIWNLAGHKWSSKGPEALTNGWLVSWKRVVDYTKTWCEDKFWLLQKKKLVENWIGGRFCVFEGLWRSHQPFLRSLFAASLRVRVAGSIKRIMLTTPMKPSLFFIAVTSTFQTSARAWTWESQKDGNLVWRSCTEIVGKFIAGSSHSWVFQL